MTKPVRLAPVDSVVHCPVTRSAKPRARLAGRTLGSGPLYPVIGHHGLLTVVPAEGGAIQAPPGAYLEKVMWVAPAGFKGPAEIRGVDRIGHARLWFILGDGPIVAKMDLTRGNAGRAEDGSLVWTGYTLLSRPGCFAYLATGPGFAQALTFRAVAGKTREGK